MNQPNISEKLLLPCVHLDLDSESYPVTKGIIKGEIVSMGQKFLQAFIVELVSVFSTTHQDTSHGMINPSIATVM